VLSTPVKVTLPPLHKGGQHQVYYDKARFKIVVCGRRWGKSLLVALKLIEVASKGGYCWWVWPSFPASGPGWKKLISLLEPLIAAKLVNVERGTKTFVFPSGGFIQFKSSEKPESLRGEGLDAVAIDEWAYCRNGRMIWESDLRPALAEKQGIAILITTPNGMDYAFEYFHLANDDPLYNAFQFPSWTNPFIPKAEFEAAKKSMPSDVFRQEYGAEFIEGGGLYFSDIRSVMLAETQYKPIPDHNYRAALDWGRTGDDTILGFVDLDLTPHQCCSIFQIPHARFSTQQKEILRHCSKFDPDLLVADATGLGFGPSESLEESAPFNVDLFKYTNARKVELFSNLKTAYELQEFLIPDLDWLELQHKMMIPEVKEGSLSVTINARPGFKDDGPNMLALLNRAREAPMVRLVSGGI
jgi:hypothetical protein